MSKTLWAPLLKTSPEYPRMNTAAELRSALPAVVVYIAEAQAKGDLTWAEAEQLLGAYAGKVIEAHFLELITSSLGRMNRDPLLGGFE